MQNESLGKLVPQSSYVRELRSELPAEAFEPATSRLCVVPVVLAVITMAIVALAVGWVPLFLAPLLSVVIGLGFGVLTFIGHEAVHGGIVRGRITRQILGWIGFLPFTISPRLWASWHDRIHHANANLPDDPD